MIGERIRKFTADIYDRLTSGQSTGEQAVQSGIWMTSLNVGDRILELIKVVILARLLSPEAFGLLGIALLAIASLEQLSKLGFDQALIQHKDENVDDYLSTAWVLQTVRGAVIAVIAVLAAPYIADFFSEPEAETLIKILGLSPLMLGMQNPAVMYFQKNLHFHKEFAYQIGSRLVDLAIAVGLAVATGSVLALPIGIAALNVSKFSISYVIDDYRPSIEFNLEQAKEMFGFGKWIFISSILVFLYGQGDDAFVGWFFTATSLGFYQLAYRFSNAPATEVTQVISKVAFPAYSKVQDNNDLLRDGYFQAVQLSTLVAFPMSAGIAAVAPQFVPVVLGNQWDPMVLLMQVLAVWGGIRALGANAGPIFKAIGRPDISVRIQAVKVVLIVIAIYPAAEYFGVIGVAAAIIGSSVITLPLQLYYLLPIIRGEVSELLLIVVHPFFASIFMLGCVLYVDTHLMSQVGVLRLLVLIAVGVVLYAAAMLLLESKTNYDLSSLYRLIRKSI